ncbi:uncharacterized protein LACBIDRAFT_302588 [Laccaria bicolor S238N-H82]|uniref:Predicted protein n=1 Tax=Laccaria bicolor (strain S238N-H82 / ATCC MYA-4686) TaxID=486041 RepID=B0DHY4_LACBS|nr:uncharacterized protein LACBIDRAFT_302588 [Laccaria bicolor S238N-H82]EDR05913.1 predicted protein [Laccaria bicolor S238N-H82]|eukprot:XP_001883589.1 predicted protein [Laccaria bicolor S238N-H82]
MHCFCDTPDFAAGPLAYFLTVPQVAGLATYTTTYLLMSNVLYLLLLLCMLRASLKTKLAFATSMVGGMLRVMIPGGECDSLQQWFWKECPVLDQEMVSMTTKFSTFSTCHPSA